MAHIFYCLLSGHITSSITQHYQNSYPHIVTAVTNFFKLNRMMTDQTGTDILHTPLQTVVQKTHVTDFHHTTDYCQSSASFLPKFSLEQVNLKT